MLNRVFLLFIGLMTCLAPLLVPVISKTREMVMVYQLPAIEITGTGVGIVPGQASGFDILTWYLAVTALVLIVLAVRLIMLRIYSGRVESSQAYSFLNKVVVGDGITGKSREAILEHERVHVRHLHTLDVLLSELVIAFCWVNPGAYLLRKYLKENHEFIADRLSAGQFKSGTYEQILLARQFGVAPSVIAHSFFSKNLLNRRMSMLSKKNKSGLFLPIVGLMVLVGSHTIIGCESDVAAKHETELEVEGSVAPSVEDRQPAFPGGMDGMIAYMTEAIVYPEEAKKDGIEGTVYLSFKVHADGTISDAEVKRSVREDLDQAALEVILNMPAWEPGIKDGKPVDAEMMLPVRYQLNE
jgi:TonB family protein